MEVYRMIFSPIEVNTYIIAEESGKCAVIDCGCYNSEEFDRLRSFITEKKLTPVMLLNTHLHLDHIFGNRYILDNYNLLTHASKLDEYNLKSASSHAMMFGLSMDEPPQIGTPLTDKMILNIGSLSLESVLVPGHTSGSIAFYIKEENCIFTGDVLFEGSIGRTDLPGGDYNTLITSIRSRLLTLDDKTVVYPGHGNSTTIGRERVENSFLR
jgi:glyoxylase-like metal-dependent hydrolase (beta-lactamase superfamily II)